MWTAISTTSLWPSKAVGKLYVCYLYNTSQFSCDCKMCGLGAQG